MKEYILIYNLIPKEKKLHFFILLILIFISIFAELLSITLIIPTIINFTNEGNSSLTLFNDKILFFNILQKLDFKILLLIFLSIFFFKTIFLSFVNYFSQSFIADVQKNITNKIFINYLKKNYTSFVSEHSSDKTRNIIELTNSYIYQCLMPLVQVITEFSFIILISFFLFLIDPISLTLVVFFIFFLMIMYFKIIDKKLYEWGRLKQIFLSQRLKTLKEAIDGIMLIKISNLSNFFLNQFKYSSDISINLTKKLLFLNNAVKYFLELFTIIILIILIFFLINRGFSKLEILSLLSLYAICSFKLLPSANRITVNIQSMKFGISVLPVIKKELFQVHNKKEYLIDHQIKFENKLIFKNIFFSYDSNFSVFENLNLEIKKNDFIGILGESGSGKSTFINLFCGLLIPTKGEIFIDTVDITQNYFDMRKTIGYVPQKIFLIDDTIKANIALGNENYSIKRINDIIIESNFAKFIEELPNGIDTKIGEDGNRLSIGQKQRLNILRALYNDPQILIFDESSSALDEKNEEIFLNLIMEFKSKKTVIFITHKSKLLKNFDKIYEIKNKQMTQVK